jgi:hypothetical protein
MSPRLCTIWRWSYSKENLNLLFDRVLEDAGRFPRHAVEPHREDAVGKHRDEVV